MIRFLILIMTVALLGACSEAQPTGDNPDGPGTSISGNPEGTSDDPLKQLQDEGGLPTMGGGGKLPILPSGASEGGVGPSAMSVYPTNVDPDQDNIPDMPITGYTGGVDNCPGLFNPTQEDSDADGHGDPCD